LQLCGGLGPLVGAHTREGVRRRLLQRVHEVPAPLHGLPGVRCAAPEVRGTCEGLGKRALHAICGQGRFHRFVILSLLLSLPCSRPARISRCMASSSSPRDAWARSSAAAAFWLIASSSDS